MRDVAPGSWWCGAVSSETELLSAAVLCAALAASTRAGDAPSAAAERDAARRELEAFIRSSPLPHQLQLPAIECNAKVVVVESESAVICAVRATNTGDIVEAVLGSTVPLAQPYVYRYGGARIHLPFWKRAQQLDLGALYSQARVRNKTLLLCGHSIAGSIAQLGLCELVYQQLPSKVRQILEKKDVEARRKDLQRSTGSAVVAISDQEPWRDFPIEEMQRVLPHVMAVGFGSPFISSHGLCGYLEPLGLTKRLVTLVNEFDCIPGILNIAQSAAMLTKTTERFLTITKATKRLFKLLPAQMQSVFVGMGVEKTTGNGIGSVTSAYITMSLNILQSTFQKFRELNVIEELDYQYSPCGTYLFMKKESKDYKLLSDTAAVLRELRDEDAASTTLTGNSILQHLMTAYVDAIARRSTSIQINESMNYYERLGVSKTATPRQIRSAYKNLALKWHPDRWSSAVNPREKDMAEQVFKLLAESYEVLSDAEARAAYDAHLAKGPSWTEEFVREGTVGGMTLDEAISTFRDVLDGATGAVSQVTSRFTSSSSSVVGQARIRRVDPLMNNNGLVPNNHQNLFAPDRVRVIRKVGIGAEQQEKIMFVQPDEVLPGDVAAPAMPNQNANGGTAGSGMRTISVLGGAVVVGASVALAVTAWNQYSDSSKRSMQAEVVRKMPGEYLLLLMDDHRARKRNKTPARIEGEQGYSTAQPDQPTVENSPADKELSLVIRDQSSSAIISRTEDEDDIMADEFYDCLSDFEEARLHAFAEDEFFDCVDLAEQVATYFSSKEEPEPLPPNTFIAEEDKLQPVKLDELIEFPVGSAVWTPFGLGTIEDWRPESSSAVIRYGQSCVGYILKSDIKRGAYKALTTAKNAMEDKRIMLSERVIERYGLNKSNKTEGILSLVKAGKDGALDSGIRAGAGVVIAKGMSRASTKLGGAVAAPLTIASILVDIGKDYYDYRQQQSERKNLGVVSATSERLMMRDFRLKAGHHIASGAAAATGASLGAYSVASAVGFWTGVGITGPVGVVAATGAAIAGGMLGFFAGSKAYTGYTASYFTSYKAAKEQIDRLELGARILFNEYDPSGSGEINKADCITIISKLYEASGSVSESGYQGVLAVLQDDRFDGPVSWSMFWEWVSTEAARTLRELEEEEARKNHENVNVDQESWWRSYTSYFNYANSAQSDQVLIGPNNSTLYPSVNNYFNFGAQRSAFSPDPTRSKMSPQSDQSDLIILRAQMEYLVNVGSLTDSDAFQLDRLLESEDYETRESAKRTITAMHEGALDTIPTMANGGAALISGGFSGDGDINDEEVLTHKISKEALVASRLSQNQAQVDVLCSLLSTEGLQHYLETLHINVPPESARHQELHCLALQATAPSTETKSNS